MSKALLKGLALTLQTFFRKPVTVQYPDEKRPVPGRFRGRPALVAREDGAPRCVACGLCEKICPSLCIAVTAETGPEGIRALARYRLDLNRCSFCGLCVEACPVEAIIMSADYELAAAGRESLVWDKGRLLAGPGRAGEGRS